MEQICPNCKHAINENFCGNCGQKKFKRIDKQYLIDELQYTTIHTNKGFLYSLKNIIKNPGKTAREFIEGNRVKHYKPIGMLFLIAGFSAFMSYKVLGLDKAALKYLESVGQNTPLQIGMQRMMSTYFAFIMLLLVPFFALTTKLAFRSWGHNYYEHVVMNTYIVSFYSIVGIFLIYPIQFVLKSNPEQMMKVSLFSFLLVPFIIFWFFKGFYTHKPLKSIALRTLATMGLTLALYLFLIIGIAVVSILAGMFLGPETMQKLIKPK